LALTPTDTNEAFLREVDDNLRRDRMIGLARRWGMVIGGIVIVGLVALAIFLFWQSRRTRAAGVEAETLATVLDDSQVGKATPADPRLQELGKSSRDGYRALSAMTAAGLAMRTSPIEAAKRYDAIANDSGQPQPIRDLAMIRATTIQFDTLAPQQVVDRMKPLAVAGGAWFGSAGELTAAAYMKMNKPKLATPLLVSIARDTSVPASIRGRAASMATALGQSVTPAASDAALKE
jgi:hypothetical protein